MSLLKDWNQFWFRRTSCGPVALVRIAMGLLVIAAALQLWPDRFVWFSEHGLLPFATSLDWNAAYTAGPRPINFLQYATQDWEITAFFIVYMLLAFCMTIGFCTRTSLFLVWIGINCIHNRDSLNNTTGGDEIMLVTTAYLFFANAGGAISVDRLIRVWRGIDQAPSRPGYGDVAAAVDATTGRPGLSQYFPEQDARSAVAERSGGLLSVPNARVPSRLPFRSWTTTSISTATTSSRSPR